MTSFIRTRIKAYSFILLVLGSSIALAIPHSFYWTDGSDLSLGLQFLFLPLAAGLLLLSRHKGVKARVSSGWQRILGAVCLAFVGTAAMTGPILWINACFGSQESSEIRGVVAEKIPSSFRSKARLVLDTGLGESQRWPVSDSDYERIEPGDRVGLRVKRGLLGFRYTTAPSNFYPTTELIARPTKDSV